MSPAEWVHSALSPTDRQTATEIYARIPAQIGLEGTVVLLHSLVDAGLVKRHEPEGGQGEATYTRVAL